MTLVLSVNGPESIWLVADRRVSYKDRLPKEDARKIMLLETTDGVAILGYAGLGATALGTEPGDWMSAVLRGRNLPLEQSLGVLAEAIKTQLPRHMLRLAVDGAPGHNVIASAFIGGEPKLYTIDRVFAPDRKSYDFRYTRHVTGPSPPLNTRTPRLAIAGSGALHLIRDKNKGWMRSLLRVVKAHDRGLVTSLAVADHLANLNNNVHLGIADKSVGPRCIVAWRHRKGGIHPGGGGHQFYSGTARDARSESLPDIANGMDVPAIVNALIPSVTKMFDEMRAGQPMKMLDRDDVNARLAGLPDTPDEKLR